MTSPASASNPPRNTAGPDGHEHRTRQRRHSPPPRASARAPDLAKTAKDAVVSFLHDASVATAEREGGRAAASMTDLASGTGPSAVTSASDVASRSADILTTPEDAIPWSAAAAAPPVVAESAAVRAAAEGIATLERIEAAAAKVEADIAAALQAHADLQAGAGQAAEAAVHAAQQAWAAASTAVDADVRAHVSLRRVIGYVSVSIVVLIIAIVILALTATGAR